MSSKTTYKLMTYHKNYIKEQILDKCDPLTREEEKVASNHDLVKHNLRYMISAYTSYLKHMTFDEYVSEIINAMYIAAEKFDRNSGYKFVTYANPWVSVLLWEYFRKYKNDNYYTSVSISSSSYKKLSKLSKFKKDFEKKYERNPDYDDYVNEFGKNMSDKTLKNHIFFSQNGYGRSTDEIINNNNINNTNDDRTYGDTLSEASVFEPAQHDIYNEIEQNDTLSTIWKRIDTFDEEYRSVARCLYVDGLSVKQTAHKLNIQPHKVSNISNEVIKKLRLELKHDTVFN